MSQDHGIINSCHYCAIDLEYNLFPDHKKMFATLIARNAKDIDVLIDSLPSEEDPPPAWKKIEILNQGQQEDLKITKI